MRNVVTGAGCVGAMLAATAATQLSVGTAAGAAAAHSGKIVAITTRNPGSGPSRDIITGAITDYGTDRPISDSLQKFTLSQGSYEVQSAQFNKSFRIKVDPKDCVVSGTGHATGAKVINGTGAYAGITGTLTLKASFTEIEKKTASGSCPSPQHATTLAGTETITATGTVSY